MEKERLAALPDILRIEDLSRLTGKAATTIRTCATNRKYAHLIPRPFKFPNSRRLCWHKEDVLMWMEQIATVQPSREPRVRRGPPTKSERLAAQELGVTVKAWRAAHDLKC